MEEVGCDKRFFTAFARNVLVFVKEDHIHKELLALSARIFRSVVDKNTLKICAHCDVSFSSTSEGWFKCNNSECNQINVFCGRDVGEAHCISSEICECYFCGAQMCPKCLKKCTMCKRPTCDDCFLSCAFCKDVNGVCGCCFFKNDARLYHPKESKGGFICETCIIDELVPQVAERTQKRLKTKESEK